MPFELRDVVTLKSKLSLAKRLRAEWQKIEPGESLPTDVSISNRLGDLEQDRDAWWQERPAARRAFEKVTGVNFRELPVARASVSSPDFPKLRPLRLGADEPLPLAKPNWFEAPRADLKPQWIVAPPGSGRSLAVQWHRIRGSARSEEVDSLVDALEHISTPGPLVISIDGPSAPDDGSAAARLGQRGELVLIATFPLPADTDQSLWNVERWQPLSDWRETLVRSIAARIEDRETLFDVDQALSWLDKRDPRQETFATPGDVVAICAFIEEKGIGVFNRDIVAPFLAERFKAAAALNPSHALWLRAFGSDVLRAMMKVRVHDVSLPLWEPLPSETWKRLPGDDLAPLALSEADIAQIIDRKGTKKKDAERLLRRRPAPEVIELLTDTRILRPHGSGLSMHPRWLGHWLAQAVVRAEVQEGDVTTWGRWAANPDRRRLVDAALDQLSLYDLERLARTVCDVFTPTSLGAAGAVEATFAAIGRKLGPSTATGTSLLPLWTLQERLLAPRYPGDDLFPITRPGVEHDSDWLASCWRWSLFGPRTTVDDRLAWMFPGWCAPSLGKLTALGRRNTGEPGWGDRLQPIGAFPHLLEMAHEVVSRATDVELPEDVPVILLPAVAVAAHRREPRWRLTQAHLKSLIGRVWPAAHLADLMTELVPDDQADVARTLWLAARGSGGLRSALDAFGHDDNLLGVVMRYLRTDDFASSLIEDDVNAVGRLHVLPARFRQSLVEHVVRHSRKGTVDLHDVLQDMAWKGRNSGVSISEHDIAWMERMADASRSRSRARQKIWAVAPERSLERALAAPLDSDDAADWFNSAPVDAYERLVGHVGSMSAAQPPPSWATLWLRRRVAEGIAPVADRAFEILRAAAASQLVS